MSPCWMMLVPGRTSRGSMLSKTASRVFAASLSNRRFPANASAPCELRLIRLKLLQHAQSRRRRPAIERSAQTKPVPWIHGLQVSLALEYSQLQRAPARATYL